MNTRIKQSFIKGYKFEIRPTKEQRDYLHMAFGHSRFVYNQTLDQLNKEYAIYIASGDNVLTRDTALKPNYNFSALSARLTVLKDTNPWLYQVSSVALQQSVKHLSAAYDTFFKGISKARKVGLPKFKSRYCKQSISLMANGFTLDGNDLYIAKVSDPIKVFWSRDLPSKPSSLTISKESNGKYYVSFTCEYNPPKTNGKDVVGLDLGIKNLYVDSDGIKEDSLVALLTPIEKVIRRLQRQLSRKDEDSNAYNRLKQRLAKWHLRLRNTRNDILHKLSRLLVDKNHVIVLETLMVSNMVRNHHLARAISMSAWTKFVQYIIYKARESQHTVIARVGQFFPSSKTCNACGCINSNLKLSDRSWVCEHCGSRHDRDENAAKNLKSVFELWYKNRNENLSAYAGGLVLI